MTTSAVYWGRERWRMRGKFFSVSSSPSSTGKYEQERFLRDFPGGPVVKTLSFHCRGHRFDHWLGN